MKRVVLLVMFAVFFTVSIENAFACECKDLEERMPYLLDSDYIFSGTVNSIENQTDTFPSYVVNFDVDKVWQGENTSKIKIISSLDSGMCAYQFAVNQTVIVHASNNNGTLKEKECGTLNEKYVSDYKAFLNSIVIADSDIRNQNIQRFTFHEDGKSATASIRADPGTQIISLDFDKNSKTLSFTGKNSQNNQGQFMMMIPSELLSGDVLIKTENDSLLLSEKNPWGDVHGPVLDASDPRHSYGVIANKIDGYTSVFYYTMTPGEKKLEVIGTTAIPEFNAFSMMILMVSIIPVVFTMRKTSFIQEK